jgi:hypothetical protein
LSVRQRTQVAGTRPDHLIGEPSGEEGYIGISISRAERVFSLPISAFKPLGRSLLLADDYASGEATMAEWTTNQINLCVSAFETAWLKRHEVTLNRFGIPKSVGL